MRKFKGELLEQYKVWLNEMERSSGTISKYMRDIQNLYQHLPENKIVTKNLIQEWKQSLIEKGLSAGTVNSSLTAANNFFRFLGWNELMVRHIRVQRQLFRDTERELSREEYLRLLNTAEKTGKHKLSMIMQSICATGIRISELKFLTVESVRNGKAEINCKGKKRLILIPSELRKRLLKWIHQQHLQNGPVFITKKGRPLDRSNIWHEMKKLCTQAMVSAKKVFPHNLRHLFAVTFYRQQKDIAKLADILGHSSIETTRIYAMESGEEHLRMINELKLML